MKIEAIAVDIDGTITDDERKLCISAIESLRSAEKAGIPTIIVTGNVVNYAYAAQVLIGCSGGLVAENGGMIFKEGYNNNAVEILVNSEYKHPDRFQNLSGRFLIFIEKTNALLKFLHLKLLVSHRPGIRLWISILRRKRCRF